MSRIFKDFQDHPRSVGETYLQHWCSAMSFSATMATLALACMVHAFVPGLFKTTASESVQDLYRRMVTQRDRRRSGSERSGSGSARHTSHPASS